LQQYVPLAVHEVPSGTRVFDWTVPKEWNIRDAYVQNAAGERVIDFRQSNLHVVGYSVPVRARMPLGGLKPHLFTLPDHPDWIPYRTSYYVEDWGFCASEKQVAALPDGEYDVVIDATLEDGALTYAECYLPGRRSDEVLVSTHICHPSLCNDNLSGIAVATFLAHALSGRRDRRYSYRFLFVPGTIGAITWLCLNEPHVARIKHGLVLSCVGDPGRCTYKRSRRGDAEIDRAAAHVLRHAVTDREIVDFSPYGYDERQYCSPGFDLPVGSFSRTPHGRFPEYHTSADDLTLVTSEALAESRSLVLDIIDVLEGNRRYVNTQPKCEPQLGRRGLYRRVGGEGQSAASFQMAVLWVLNLSDGRHSLLDIAERSGLAFGVIGDAAAALRSHGLLRPEDGEAEGALDA
jgi:aminopeptidase-like protein